MGKSIDDAYDDADRQRAQRERSEKKKAQDDAIYDAQANQVAASYLAAVRQKAEKFNANARTKNKAAITAAGFPASIRRASDTGGVPDRRVRLEFRKDQAELSWIYEVSPNPVWAEYEGVDSGSHGFYIENGELRVVGADSPQDFADMVLDRFIDDCAHDY